MPRDLTIDMIDKSTLVQVMAWCRQATSHYLSQCWPRSMSPYGVTRPQWVNWTITSQTPLKLLGFYRTKDRFWPDFADTKHDYRQAFYQSYSSFISQCPRTGKFCGVWHHPMLIHHHMHHQLQNPTSCEFSHQLVVIVSCCFFYSLAPGRFERNFRYR